MSAAIGGSTTSRAGSPKAPDKGSFPLDHYNECKDFMRQFMECMQQNKKVHAFCRDQTKAYLQCRMERELMTPEDLNRFGLNETIDVEKAAKINDEWEKKKQQKYEQGFVAGHHRRKLEKDQ